MVFLGCAWWEFWPFSMLAVGSVMVVVVAAGGCWRQGFGFFVFVLFSAGRCFCGGVGGWLGWFCSHQGRFWIHSRGVCGWLGTIFGIGDTQRVHGGQSDSSSVSILGLDLVSRLASDRVIVGGSHWSGIGVVRRR